MPLKSTERKLFAILFVVYAVACLIHFIHNAEFLVDYPGMATMFTRSGVYLVWVGMTVLGVSGWMLLRKGYKRVGLLMVVVYALLGMDSLGHYVLGSFSAHTVAMNTTILLEVTAAGLLLIETLRLLVLEISGRVVSSRGV